MEPGCLGRLLDMGWARENLAFFEGMPEDEVRGLLPGVADDWTAEEHGWLQREAKRQRLKLDIEDHMCFTKIRHGSTRRSRRPPQHRL